MAKKRSNQIVNLTIAVPEDLAEFFLGFINTVLGEMLMAKAKAKMPAKKAGKPAKGKGCK